MASAPASVKYVDLANDPESSRGVILLVQRVLMTYKSSHELFAFFQNIHRDQWMAMFDYCLSSHKLETDEAADTYHNTKAELEKYTIAVGNLLGKLVSMKNASVPDIEQAPTQVFIADAKVKIEGAEQLLKKMEKCKNYLLLRDEELEKARELYDTLWDIYESQGSLKTTINEPGDSVPLRTALYAAWERLQHIRKRYVFLKLSAEKEG